MNQDLRARVQEIALRIETRLPPGFDPIDALWYLRSQAAGMYMVADSPAMLGVANVAMRDIDQLLAQEGALETDALRARARRLILAAVERPIASTPELPAAPEQGARLQSWIEETTDLLRRWLDRDPRIAAWRKRRVEEAVAAAHELTGFRVHRTLKDIHDSVQAMIPDADLRTLNAGWLSIVERLVRDELYGHAEAIKRIGEGPDGRLEVEMAGADDEAAAAVVQATNACWQVCAFCGRRDGVAPRAVAYGGRHPHRVCGRHEF